MSGGHFEYQDFRLHDMAETLKEDIEKYSKWREDEYGKYPPLPPDVLLYFKRTRDLLRITEQLVHRADYLLSDDDGEDSYRERTHEELLRLLHESDMTEFGKETIRKFLDIPIENQ